MRTCPPSLRTLITCLVLGAGTSLAAGQGVKLWTAPSYERVMLQQAPADMAGGIAACRNETESLQVIASGTGDDLARLTYHFEAATDTKGNILPAPKLYWQYDIPVTKSSPRAPMPAGLYPDALVPFANGSKANNSAFRNRPGTVNFRIWVDIRVPATQPPGSYTGTCVAKRDGCALATLRYTVDVLDETLPKRPALKSFFGLNEHRIARLSGLDREDDGNALSHVMDGYYQLMADHRVEPGLVFGTSAPVSGDGEILWHSPASATLPAAGEIVRRYFNEGTFRSLHLPMWRDYPFADPLGNDRLNAVAYLAKLAKLCRQAAPDAELMLSVGSLDEPDSPEAYQKIREWSVLVHSASQISGEKIAFFVTEQPQPQDAAWGSLNGAVDIWAPHVMWAWEDLESKPGKRMIAGRIAAGEGVWCYPALSQFRDTWKKEKGEPQPAEQPCPPVWLTDYPPVHFRILPWICAAHNLSGIHYWDVFHWPERTDPWKDAGTFVIDDETFNGDGLLIYPPAPAALRGDAPAVPCASVRLKWIRDGMDDYDHLNILRKTHPERAASILARVAAGFADWETSPQGISQARRAISEAMQNSP